MPQARRDTLDSIVAAAIAPAIARASGSIARAIAAMVAGELEKQLAPNGRARQARGAATRRPARGEITKWVADRRARRVPNFVIEATRLDTKKKIVAKYGEDAVFEKSKPLPHETGTGAAREMKMKAGIGAAREMKAAREVKAKPPTIRKAAAAGK